MLVSLELFPVQIKLPVPVQFKPEVRPFTWGIITCWVLLMPLGYANKEARLTSTYHNPPKHH